ncbi:hypothetical protein B0F90DRAFT_330059 [Multifurca ochricompacta]|uniref:Uncharacterized protein n=1 Tax=Multifurca ochricompacta TaxID=376703 RepID=A0AAD4LXT9_9AGAM|nr:hypothetical protein B0F90DRAFT_330059 [Multifurca ochricompacta]
MAISGMTALKLSWRLTRSWDASMVINLNVFYLYLCSLSCSAVQERPKPRSGGCLPPSPDLMMRNTDTCTCICICIQESSFNRVRVHVAGLDHRGSIKIRHPFFRGSRLCYCSL